MKTNGIFTSKLAKVFVIGLIGLQIMACGKKSSDDPVAAQTARTEGVRDSVGIGPNGTICMSGLPRPSFYRPELGWVATPDANGQFNTIVKGFLSATIDPKNVGLVDNQDGIDILGQINVNSSGCMMLQNSFIEIRVYDSFAVTEPEDYEPFIVRLKLSGAAGNVNDMTLIFNDNVGTVTLKGKIANGELRGALSFANTTHVTKGAAGKESGTIGEFAIPVSALLNWK